MKKIILIVLATFGFNSFGASMADMMSDEGGMNGSLWLKYKALEERSDTLSYRARLGWAGSVTDSVKWGVAVTTSNRDLGTSFRSPASLTNVALEQAYVAWAPVDGVYVTAGKKGWTPSFNKVGILWDEDLYPEGVTVKYKQKDDGVGFFVKVAAYQLNSVYSGPFANGINLVGKVGGSFELSDGVGASIYAGVSSDAVASGDQDTTTLAKVGVNVSADNMEVPVGAFGTYLANTAGLTENIGNSWTAGVYVGDAGAVGSGEMGDFGVSASYYDVKASDYNTSYLNTDYVQSDSDVKGVAVRAQYNVLDNTNFVLKYSYDLAEAEEDANKSSLIGQLNFSF